MVDETLCAHGMSGLRLPQQHQRRGVERSALSDLVIGEGVALDLRLAKVPSRALARLLDLLVQAGLLGVLAAVLGVVVSSGAVDDAVMAGLLIVMIIVVVVGYPALLETVTRGRTLGKMALGLRVVRTDGGPVRFRHALVRALTGIFDFYATAGVLAVVTSFSSRQGRRTGDWLAGTVVVRDRAPDAGVSPAGMAALAMPYPLLGWAQQADLSALPDDVALSVRQFLTRMHEMREDVAARMGHELASEVMRYVALPPSGTPPWAYLAGVTAERRVRQMRAVDGQRRAEWERGQGLGLGVVQGQGQAGGHAFGVAQRQGPGWGQGQEGLSSGVVEGVEVGQVGAEAAGSQKAVEGAAGAAVAERPEVGSGGEEEGFLPPL